MIKNIFKAGLILCTAFTAKAQLTVNSAMTPTQLVQNVLLGSGVTASNITFSGPNAARGEFNGTASNIGFPGGVILATGDISVAVGPNNSGSLSNGGTGTISTDPQLTGIATNTLYDAAILEFDFVPLADTLKFRYVFGSEEYMEFANSSFNDVFGFFLNSSSFHLFFFHFAFYFTFLFFFLFHFVFHFVFLFHFFLLHFFLLSF